MTPAGGASNPTASSGGGSERPSSAPQALNAASITKIPAQPFQRVVASKKNKIQVRGEPSPCARSPKRSCRGETSTSLASGLLGEGLRFRDMVSVHLTSEVKEMIRGLSDAEVLRTVHELSLRLAVLTQCFNPEADRLRITQLEKTLEDTQKKLQQALATNVDIASQLKESETIKIAHSECAGKLKDALDRLAASVEKEKVSSARARRLQRQVDDMTVCQSADRKALDEWAKKYQEVLAELAEADEEVFKQYASGFQKALDQAAYFFDIPIDRPNTFDANLVVQDGKLVHMYLPSQPEDDDTAQLVQPVKVEGATK